MPYKIPDSHKLYVGRSSDGDAQEDNVASIVTLMMAGCGLLLVPSGDLYGKPGR